MNTFLGAAQDLHPKDIDEAAIAASAVIYLEGYLWDPPHAKELSSSGGNRPSLRAARRTHFVGRLLRERFRPEFLNLIRKGTSTSCRQ